MCSFNKPVCFQVMAVLVMFPFLRLRFAECLQFNCFTIVFSAVVQAFIHYFFYFIHCLLASQPMHVLIHCFQLRMFNYSMLLLHQLSGLSIIYALGLSYFTIKNLNYLTISLLLVFQLASYFNCLFIICSQQSQQFNVITTLANCSDNSFIPITFDESPASYALML